jgi:apolipoprotein N-acyltransferase
VLPAVLPFGLMALPHAKPADPAGALAVAGVQHEEPTPNDVIRNLDEALRQAPLALLFVMSEYTYNEAPPPELLNWCREHTRHVLVGGKDLVWDRQGDTEVYNTAFVIGPDGAVHHKQAKSVPIQFMNDGLPAKYRHVWDGPLGKIGIAICYDMNYSRVMDELIQKDAALLVIPAFDSMSWGNHAHRLSAQLAAVRSAEYGVPLFRLASSGFSRIVTPDGKVAVEIGVPGQGHVIHGQVYLPANGRRPLDRWLAWPCVILTAGLAVFLIADAVRRSRAGKRVATAV